MTTTGASGARRLDAVSLDERRAQLVAWTISTGLGAAWIALVHLTPLPVPPTIAREEARPAPEGPIIKFELDADRRLAAGAPGVVEVVKRNGARTAKKVVERLEVAGAFTAAVGIQAATEIARVMRGVQAAPGEPMSVVISGDKAALAIGTGHGTPGMAKLESAGGGGTGDIGSLAIGRGERISRSAVVARPLPVVTAPGLSGAAADAGQVGGFVRERSRQLQTCYEREAGSSGALAGVVTLRLTLGEGGAVRDAIVVRRTWDGPAAAAAERCLLGVVARWTLPSGGAGATVTLPISFTAGR